jgi:hypothetical protein
MSEAKSIGRASDILFTQNTKGEKMKEHLKPLIMCAVVGLSGIAGGGAWAQVTSYETEGNLEVTHDIGCVDSGELKNVYSAADLYKGLAKCINDEAYERGVLLFAMAGVYGRYDTLRVADQTAHQATTVLGMTYLQPLDEARRLAFQAKMKEILGTPDGLERVCSELRKIGAPAYFPSYMIQHGMGAVLGDTSKGLLIDGFDSESAWKKSLDSYLHCPGA